MPGVDLLGTYGRAIDDTAVRPRAMALVQVGAIVLGHVRGVVLAHDRAVRGLPGRATFGQVPLLSSWSPSPFGGLALLLSS